MPFRLVSDERVLRFNVEAPAVGASMACRDGDGALLPEGVASVFESSAVLLSSMTALLVEATGAGMGALREICDRR